MIHTRIPEPQGLYDPRHEHDSCGVGFVVDLKELKDIMEREVVDAMDHRYLNHEVPEFKEVMPTTENIAIAIWKRLEGKLHVARLHRVRVPTLVIWGQSDGIVSPDYGERLCRSVPDARLELIQEAGHYPQIERPDSVADAIERFAGSEVEK